MMPPGDVMAESYIVKVEAGIVRLYQKNGLFERVICAGALGAEVVDDEIVVEMQGGKKKIYSVRGFFKRNA